MQHHKLVARNGTLLFGDVLASDGHWETLRFLLDTGADRTVLSADVLAELGHISKMTSSQLGGVGGAAKTVQVETEIRLPCEGGGRVVFKGDFAAFTEADALDMSVLGRDVLDIFAAIVDRPGEQVCLLRSRHEYAILFN